MMKNIDYPYYIFIAVILGFCLLHLGLPYTRNIVFSISMLSIFYTIINCIMILNLKRRKYWLACSGFILMIFLMYSLPVNLLHLNPRRSAQVMGVFIME